MAQFLIIDNGKGSAESVSQWLKRGFHDAVVALVESGEEGIEKAMASPPDVVLINLSPADLKGADISRKLKNHPDTVHIPILLLKGTHVNGIDLELALENGAESFLNLPLKEGEFLAQMKSLVSLKTYQNSLISEKEALESLAREKNQMQHELDEHLMEEEILRKSDAFHSALFEYNPVQTIVVDRECKIVKFNKAKRQSLDKLPEIGMVMYKDYASKHEIDMHKELVNCMANGLTRHFPELSYKSKILSITISPFPLGAVIISEDITQRKRAEAALHESEEFNYSLLLQSPNPILVTNRDLSIRYVNPALEKLTGFASADLAGKTPPYPWWLEEMDKQTLSQMKKRLRRGEKKVERLFQNRKRKKFWVEITSTPMRINRKIRFYLSTWVDITKRKYIEDALRENQERLSTFMNSAVDGFSVFDLELNLVEMNKSALQLYLPGTDKESVAGNHVFDIFPEFKHSEWYDKYMEVIQTGAPSHIERTLHHPELGERIVSEKIFEVGDGLGVITSDITRQKKDENKIKSSLKEKDVLLKEIHHRVKNNMQIISSLLNLQAEHEGDHKILNIFKETRSRIRSMALIHEKLYQSSDLASINFYEYINSLTAHLFHMYQKRVGDIQLTLDIRDIFLGVDTSIPCGLIINELFSNSLKYAFPEEKWPQHIEKEILISLKEEKLDSFSLIYQDNGIGLPPHFDLKSSKTLGLQLIHILTEQLQGTLHLDREFGTRFIISFKIS